MTDCGPVKRTLPTHFTQMLTVTRYEMLKYMGAGGSSDASP